jgi:putative aldouronate transport system substrate-binding protein
MKMKRFLSMLLVLTMLLALISACGSSTTTTTETTETAASTETTEETATPEEVSTAPATEESAAPVSETPAEDTAQAEETSYFPLAETETVTWWNIWMPMFGDLAADHSELRFFEAAQEALNINIDFTGPSFQSASENFGIMVASGDLCDMVWGFTRYYTGGTIDGAIDDDIILDLTDAVAKWAPDYQAARTATEELAKDTMTSNGRIAALCTISSAEGSMPAAGPMIRGDWLDELGLDMPVTFDDYEEVLTAFETNYGAGFGLPASGLFFSNYFSDAFDIKLPWGSGEAYYTVDGQIYYGPVSENYKELLTLLNRWNEMGFFGTDFTSDADSANSGVVSTDRISSGDVGVFFGRPADMGNYNEYVKVDDPNAYVIGSTSAVREAGQETHLRGATASADAGTAIAASAQNVELCVRILNWFYTDEGYLLCNYGVEGESYDMVDGQPTYSDAIFKDPNYSSSIMLGYYTAGSGYVPFYNDNTKNYQIYSEEQMAAAELWTSNADNSYNITKTMSQIMTPEEYEEYSTLYSDIATYFSECHLAFVMGTKPLDEFDSYVETMKQMGLDRVLELVDTAWNRYNNE